MSIQRVIDKTHERFDQKGRLIKTVNVGVTSPLDMHTLEFSDGEQENFLSYQINDTGEIDPLEGRAHKTHCFRYVEEEGEFLGCKYGPDNECPMSPGDDFLNTMYHLMDETHQSGMPDDPYAFDAMDKSTDILLSSFISTVLNHKQYSGEDWRNKAKRHMVIRLNRYLRVHDNKKEKERENR